jgi:hypothetical protein
MRYRVSFAVPPGTQLNVAQLLVQGVELEAATVTFGPDQCVGFHNEASELIIAYTPGVVRSVAAVGAYTEATKALPKETPGEDPGRRQAGR